MNSRNECGLQEHPYGCLTESYSLRKGELLSILGAQNWLKPGEVALFVNEELTVPEEFGKTALYQRIVPTLVGASMSEILVNRDQDDLYSIRGSAVGANAHICSLGASDLYFEKKPDGMLLFRKAWRSPFSEYLMTVWKPLPMAGQTMRNFRTQETLCHAECGQVSARRSGSMLMRRSYPESASRLKR